jgi:CheY-like chemotaxis protein
VVAENSELSPLQRPGVLVVDDEALMRSMLRAGLEREGFQVFLAAGGEEALDLYQQHQESVVVVLLDIRMPGLDGPQTCDRLRRLNPEVRVCFMSGDLGGYNLDELRARGGRDVVLKPFRLDELAERLRLLARGVSTEPVASCES